MTVYRVGKNSINNSARIPQTAAAYNGKQYAEWLLLVHNTTVTVTTPRTCNLHMNPWC